MRTKVNLEAHGLREVIKGSKQNHNKDHLALSMILNSVSESQCHQINIKKSAKENCEILYTLHVEVYQVVQSKVQALKRDFWTLLLKKNKKKCNDYSLRFLCVIFSLRDLGEKLGDIKVVLRLLRSLIKRYDSLIIPLGQFGDLNTTKIEEAILHLKVHELRLPMRSSR